MTEMLLFPFSEAWGFYLGFLGLVVLLLLVDLGIFHRHAHVVKAREAATWSAVWIGLALLFNLGLYYYALHTFPTNPRLMAIPGFDAAIAAKQVSLEFLAGFVIEKSLAVDNIFVFVLVFAYFKVPGIYQHRVLFFGILGALIFRALFIALGASLLQFHWVVLVAGAFLVFTGLKILFLPEKQADPGSNPLIALVKKMLPVTQELHGQSFFIRKNKKLYATPLFLALLFIEFSDIIFAIDSVPAIFAITKEPMIVFTSNIFAILGLRALYNLLAGVVDRFHFLKYALGLILVFVGSKMTWLNEFFGGKFPITWSLAIIGTILVGAVILSLIIKPKLKPQVASADVA